MADRSAIEWTDASWNPVTGCTKVSPGCDNCYAETFAERWRGVPGHPYEQGFDVRLWPDRLELPLHWRRPRRVFVNSMSDLFHDAVPDDFIAHVFAVMTATPRHTFQVLTKRPGRMRSLLASDEFWTAVNAAQGVASRLADLVEPWWPAPNVWLGVSVEDQRWADIRIPALLETPAAIRWLSLEPLLGAVDLRPFVRLDVPGTRALAEPSLRWAVTGGESGPGARPAHPDWFREIRDVRQAGGIAYFHKQAGEWLPIGPLYERPDDDGEAEDARMDAVTYEVDARKQVVQLERSGHVATGYQPTDPRTWLMARVGKKVAGRELDGRTWDEYPQPLLTAARHTGGA